MPRNGENIYRRKDGRWEARYAKGFTLDGKVKYGSIYGKTYEEVKEARNHICSGFSKSLTCNQNILFSHVSNIWLNKKKSIVKQSTFTLYSSILNRYIIPELGAIPVKRLTQNHIQHFLMSLSAINKGDFHSKKELSSKTKHDIWGLLKSILKFASTEFHISSEIYNIMLPSCQFREMRVLSWEEQKQLEAYVKSDIDLNKLGILLCLYTGMRLGELCALQWGDFNVNDGTIKICKTVQRIKNLEPDSEYKTKLILDSPKTKRSLRLIPVPAFLIKTLRSFQLQYSKDAYILSGSSEYFVEPRTYQNRFYTIIKQAGISKANFHDLRHPYVKHTTKIFSLRLMDFQAQAYPDARRKTRGACQLLRVGQSRSPVRPLCNRKRFSCLPPQSKMSWILYAISMRLSGYTSTRSISSSASSVVSVSASKIALDASMRLSCRACSSCFCFACANTAA